MEILRILILILVAILMVGGKEICPKMCTCDIFEGLKRADCSDQNLASPYTNVAKSVEILNLSGNEITTIDNECLKDYRDLIKLSFARNSIHNIDLFAFETLEKLNYLDLSDNRLEVVDNRILETNLKLSFLDLSKNKFMIVDDKPLIISETLEFLSLRNSHLSHVYDSFFSELPNLVDLDISNNLLNTLVTSAFEPIDSLQFINLEYNRFSCDYRIEDTLQMFKQRKVHVKIDKCVKNSKKPMFEKMILHPDVTTESPREDIEIDLVWGSSTSYKHNEFEIQNETGFYTFKDYYEKIKAESVNEEDEFDCDDDEMFPSTCECHQKYIKFYENIENFKPIQKRNVEMRIATVFYLGIFFGAVGGSIIFFCISLIWKKCSNASKKQVERQQARDRMVFTSVRMAEPIPQCSPMPAVRSHFTTPPAFEQIIPSRSPIPVPRNIQNNSASLINRPETLSPNITRRTNPPTPSPSPMPSRRSDSPDVRRRTEPPSRNRNLTSLPTDRLRVEPSPTALLIHKLFRNRDQRLLPDRSEIAPLQPGHSRTPSQLPELRIEEETVYSEIPTAPAPTEPDDDSGSEYLSIDDLSLTLNLENMRNESVTPPPAYRSIFDDDK